MLSNYCIFDIIDNAKNGCRFGGMLWIAFKLLYLWHYWQHLIRLHIGRFVVNCFQIIVSLTLLTTPKTVVGLAVCCELLSNYCIFDIIDNPSISLKLPHPVVNCFQIIVSLTLLTTASLSASLSIMLWIAFKLLYLWHYWQQGLQVCPAALRCELLSNYCIFDIIDNGFELKESYFKVVNCFQIIVSLTLLTTRLEQ